MENVPKKVSMTILKGKVVLEKFAKGSKSEHNAVFLDTGGKLYRLRKKGGNPFFDASLHELVGKSIEAEGEITPKFFIITNEPHTLNLK